ncbi:unnamed protein product [Pleuronectes platessa]|uniref:Uncharacterized protein n=1 Tax=Pleuronectes platessa TaxID=8262 RepID=A0A9N7YYF8_PLEPL|nr:unnamed protein product [Pleuronectes platessa]
MRLCSPTGRRTSTKRNQSPGRGNSGGKSQISDEERIHEHDTAHVLYQNIFIDEVGFNLVKRRRRGRNVIGQRASVQVPGQGPITLPVSSSSWMACMTCWYHLAREMTHSGSITLSSGTM